METPYELLIRFNPNGTVAGMISKTLIQINGRVFESDPVPIASANDPAFLQFAQAFSASVVAERDSLLNELEESRAAFEEANEGNVSAIASLQLELQAAQEEKASIQAQNESIQAELQAARDLIESLQNPVIPSSKVYPRVMQKRFSTAQRKAIWTSEDEIVIDLVSDLFTVQMVDVSSQEVIQGFGYLAMIGLIDQAEIPRFLAPMSEEELQ